MSDDDPIDFAAAAARIRDRKIADRLREGLRQQFGRAGLPPLSFRDIELPMSIDVSEPVTPPPAPIYFAAAAERIKAAANADVDGRRVLRMCIIEVNGEACLELRDIDADGTALQRWVYDSNKDTSQVLRALQHSMYAMEAKIRRRECDHPQSKRSPPRDFGQRESCACGETFGEPKKRQRPRRYRCEGVDPRAKIARFSWRKHRCTRMDGHAPPCWYGGRKP